MNLEDSIVERLEKLMRDYPVAFYDLVNSARNNEGVWTETADVLKTYSYYNNFVSKIKLTVNESVSKTIRERVRGRGARLRIINAGGKENGNNTSTNRSFGDSGNSQSAQAFNGGN